MQFYSLISTYDCGEALVIPPNESPQAESVLNNQIWMIQYTIYMNVCGAMTMYNDKDDNKFIDSLGGYSGFL